MMTTIERKNLTRADGEFNWDAASEIFENIDDVFKAFHAFYDHDGDIEIEITNRHKPIAHDIIFDHHEQEMNELYGTPGGQYDRDTGCFCIPRRNHTPA